MFDFLKDFFVEHQPTIEDAQDKAESLNWQMEETPNGYTVRGQGYNAETNESELATWSGLGAESANGLMDHALSIQMGEEYREANSDASKQEIRDFRSENYYEEAYKPGWKRFLGL